MAINLRNAQNTHPLISPNRSQHTNSTPMRENATSNANDHSICSNKKISVPVPISGTAREVGRDGAGDADGGNAAVDGHFGRGSTASDIIKTEGCLGEPEGSHV